MRIVHCPAPYSKLSYIEGCKTIVCDSGIMRNITSTEYLFCIISHFKTICMNTYFVKNQEVALSLDGNAQRASKDYYTCCPSCGNSFATVNGYLVVSPLTRRQLKDLGVLVSATSNVVVHN
jgi:hypothetical protein